MLHLAVLRQVIVRLQLLRVLLHQPEDRLFRLLALLLGLHPAFFDHALDQLVDELVEFLGFAFAPVLEPLIEQALGNTSHLDELFENGLTQRVESVRVAHVLKAVAEAALQEELG